MALVLMLIGPSSVSGQQPADIPVPEFYGFYAVSDGQLVPMVNAKNRLKWAGISIMGRVGVDPIGGPQLTPDSYFLLFGPEWKTSQLRIVRLEFAQTVSALNPVSLKSVEIPAGFWVAGEAIGRRAGPVRGMDDLQRLVPTAPLQPGAYAVVSGPFDETIERFNASAVWVCDFYVGGRPSGQTTSPSVAETAPPPTSLNASAPLSLLAKQCGHGTTFQEVTAILDADLETAWSAILDYLSEAERALQLSSEEHGVIVTDSHDGWKSRDQYFIRLREGSHKSTEVALIYAFYTDTGEGLTRSLFATSDAKGELKKIQKQLSKTKTKARLAGLLNYTISPTETDLSGNWHGALVDLKRLEETDCSLHLEKVPTGRYTGIYSQEDLNCNVSIESEEIIGSMVLLSWSATEKECRKLAKNRHSDATPTTDGRLLLRVFSGRDSEPRYKAVLSKP